MDHGQRSTNDGAIAASANPARVLALTATLILVIRPARLGPVGALTDDS
jgi:hypothetical protein